MRIIFVSLIAIQLLAACSPASPINSPALLETVGRETLRSNGETEQAQSKIMTTSLPTSTPLSTAVPLSTPTSAPVTITFDRDGYRQFALLRNSFQGFLDFRADRNFSEISTSLSPDGSRVAVSACWGSMTNTLECETSSSGFLVVLDTKTGDLISNIPLGVGWPGRTAFTADGTSLIYSTHERKVALWNLSTNTQDLVLYDKQGSRSIRLPDVAASPDGHSYAAVVDGILFAWDTAGKLLFQTPAVQTKWKAGLSYSADGSRLITLSLERAGVDVYSTSDWTLVRRISLDEVEDAAISPDGLVLAGVNALENTVNVWNIGSDELLAEFVPNHRVQTMTFNPKGDLLVLIGSNNLNQPDDYSAIGSLYDTQTWTKLDTLYSFSSDGEVRFSRDGQRFGIVGYGFDSIWGMPDAQLESGLEVVKRFQTALENGDYATAASLFELDERDTEFNAKMGLNPKDLAGSLETLCSKKTIFCHEVQELVLMGYDWDDMVYMVRLKDSDGKTFTSPKGAQIIFLYLKPGADGQPRIFYLPQD